MGKPGRGRDGTGTALGWLGIVALAVIAVVGAVGGEDVPFEISDESGALCLACFALASGWLQQMVSAHRLTDREVQISRHVGFGWKNHDIATHLGISTRTIDAHLRHVYAKLGIHTRVELALLVRGHPEP